MLWPRKPSSRAVIAASAVSGHLPGQVVTVRTVQAQPSIPAARLLAGHVQQ